MRIRLSLTLDIDRAAPEVPEPPAVHDRGEATTERAETPPLGFHIKPTNHQDPEDRA